MRKTLFVVIMLLSSMMFSSLNAQESAPEKTIKRIVTIGRFTNETQYGKGAFYNRDNDPMRKQCIDLLTTKLAATGKFILVEMEDVSTDSLAGLNGIHADYVITGSLTQYGRKNEGHERVFTSEKTQTVEAGVSVRMVDVSSRLIVYADEAKGFAETTTKTTLGIGGTAGFDATLSDKAISAAMTQLVENIVNKCMDRPWRGYVVAKDEDTYIITGGQAQGLTPGDQLKVYQKGKTIKNPQSGMMVELPGKQIGVVTLLSSTDDLPENQLTFCQYEGTELGEDLTQYYVSDK
ncbi:MAG: CsgG/HfaB family protein [Paludibacteraceae bacterium]|nr:CsgG/HfaB family protein [Paludibacteraceae bacterium]